MNDDAREIAALAFLAAPKPEFGILFLGIFVGGILGYGLLRAGGNLKAGLTVLGAALGGGPVLFMTGIQDARWAYPVGLVLGLLLLRTYETRTNALDSRRKRGHRLFAWIDLIVIVLATVGAVVWTAW